ncbi:hypothetical protein FKM82_027399 [Ascaphus truei]
MEGERDGGRERVRERGIEIEAQWQIERGRQRQTDSYRRGGESNGRGERARERQQGRDQEYKVERKKTDRGRERKREKTKQIDR